MTSTNDPRVLLSTAVLVTTIERNTRQHIGLCWRWTVASDDEALGSQHGGRGSISTDLERSEPSWTFKITVESEAAERPVVTRNCCQDGAEHQNRVGTLAGFCSRDSFQLRGRGRW